MRTRRSSYEVVEAAVFYDVDRCMYDTEKGFELLVDVTDAVTSYGKADMMAAYQQSKREGVSFNYVSDINQKLGARAYQTLVEPAFIDAAKKTDLRMPGATALIEHAESAGMPLSFLTFGYASPDHHAQAWQDAYAGQIGKGRAVGFTDYPFHVVDDIRKGDTFRRWVYDRHHLMVPAELSPWGEPYLLKQALFVDDKTPSFVGIPPHVTGIHVIPSGEENAIAAQSGYLPDAVVSVRGLTEALGAQKMFTTAHLGNKHH